MKYMAEVRKKVVEDKFNTRNIKTTKKTKKESSKKQVNIEKVEKKEESKKSFFARVRIFINGVKGEFHKIHWTSKENMIKYSTATIFFILFCSGFFYAIDVLFAFIRSIFN